MKPHLGKITDWYRYECEGHGLDYRIIGRFIDHPKFAGLRGNTSHVIAHDELTGEIETRNSRYTLIGPEVAI